MARPRTLVPVSKLAWYADDPDSFMSFKAGTRDAAAASAGDKAHRNLVRPKTRLRRFGYSVLVCALVLFLLLAYLR